MTGAMLRLRRLFAARHNGRAALAALLLLSITPVFDVPAGERMVLFREDFRTLDNWKPLYFPKIKNHSTYTVAEEDGGPCLKAESDASASAIVFRDSFSVYEHPKARWRWKVSRVYEKGSTDSKAGDDYPLRVYVMFEYDPARAGTFEKIQYGLAKKLYGEYPPHSTVSYVWANREGAGRIVTSPYTDRAKMVLLQAGGARAGAWQDEEVDILADYEQAFGAKPPARARLAIMNDSDNTGERSVSFLRFIEVFR